MPSTLTKREPPQAVEERGSLKAKHACFFGPILFGVVVVVALFAFILCLASFQYEVVWGFAVYGLFSLAVPLMVRVLVPTVKGNWRERRYRWPEWSLFTHFFIIGLGLNWACVFLAFSRKYAIFSTPVIAVTGLTMAFYAAIALLVAWLDSSFNNAQVYEVNWRTALLVFVFVPAVLAAIVLRLRLLQ